MLKGFENPKINLVVVKNQDKNITDETL